MAEYEMSGYKRYFIYPEKPRLPVIEGIYENCSNRKLAIKYS